MANFPLLKAYLLDTLDAFIERHGLAGPFLDVGCGQGDVAAHLAARGWAGRAIDASAHAVEQTRRSLRAYPRVEVACETLEELGEGSFPTVVMLDVLEHVADDQDALRAASVRQPRGGGLVLCVPTNPPREWRWDDDLYGHLRRYDPGSFAALLAGSGYELVEMWDVTYPVFWFLRRGFTAIKRAPDIRGSAWERTMQSQSVQAWDIGVVSRALSHRALHRPIFALQRRFRSRLDRGHEMMVVARRT